jgi:hypothetical protein
MRDTFLWSAADKDKIAALLVQGLSASQIAAKFDGVGRGAIIGVIHRDARLKAIGLAKRPGFDKPQATTAPVVKRARAPRLAKPQFVTRPEPAAPAPLNLPLHELDSKQCKWPVNDVPKGGRFLFCGHGPRVEGSPYCAYHHSRARRVDLVDR